MISIIVAIGENREIGKANGLLWHIPEELKRFKQITMGHPIIMGRKTYESIGRPLPGRTNIVISRSHTSVVEQGVIKADSLEEAIKQAMQAAGREEIFIIGGGQIYKQAIGYADKLYLTIVKGKFEADVYFPDYSEFKKEIAREEKSNAQYQYTFVELTR